jgi:hypothetical protein
MGVFGILVGEERYLQLHLCQYAEGALILIVVGSFIAVHHAPAQVLFVVTQVLLIIIMAFVILYLSLHVVEFV